MLTSTLWWVPFVAGLADAVNPCVFITCAVFILWFGWLRGRALGQGRYCVVFLAVLYVLTLCFNIGIAQGLLYAPLARQFIHAVYVFLGFVSFAAGLVFLNDWYLLVRGQSNGFLSVRYWALGNCSPFVAWLVNISLAFILSVLASVWPMNYYMGMIGNNALMPGQFWITALLMAVYTAFVLIPIFSMKLILGLFKSNARLFYVLSAAVFISGGIGAIYIFK